MLQLTHAAAVEVVQGDGWGVGWGPNYIAYRGCRIGAGNNHPSFTIIRKEVAGQSEEGNAAEWARISSNAVPSIVRGDVQT